MKIITEKTDRVYIHCCDRLNSKPIYYETSGYIKLQRIDKKKEAINLTKNRLWSWKAVVVLDNEANKLMLEADSLQALWRKI
jgi:hypothetical protein